MTSPFGPCPGVSQGTWGWLVFGTDFRIEFVNQSVVDWLGEAAPVRGSDLREFLTDSSVAVIAAHESNGRSQLPTFDVEVKSAKTSNPRFTASLIPFTIDGRSWFGLELRPPDAATVRLLKPDSAPSDPETAVSERSLVERLFSQTFEIAPYAKLVVDGSGRIRMANRAAHSFFGVESRTLIDRHVESLIPDDRRDVYAKLFREYLRSPESRWLESGRRVRARLASGEVCEALIRLSPVGVAGETLILVMIQDLRAMQAAELALRDSQERFALAIAGTDTGIWDWDLRRNVVFFSPRWKAQLGYDEEELSNDFDEWERRLHPADRERALATVQRYLAGEVQEYQLEHRLLHRDGSYRWILARGAAVRDENGKVHRMVGSHLDVTELKEAQRTVELGRAERLAAQKLQTSLLQPDPGNLGWLEIAAQSVPAEFAGGDFYQYLQTDSNELRVALGDVSGHGFPSALLMASMHTFLDSSSPQCSTLNELMFRASRFAGLKCQDGRFVTLITLQFDERSRSLEWSNAGHVPSGYLLDAEGAVRLRMKAGIAPLGLLDQVRPIISDPVSLKPGEIIVLMSDGLPETFSAAGPQLGDAHFLDVIQRHRHQSARDICHAVFAEASVHGDALDDRTVVIIKVREV